MHIKSKVSYDAETDEVFCELEVDPELHELLKTGAVTSGVVSEDYGVSGTHFKRYKVKKPLVGGGLNLILFSKDIIDSGKCKYKFNTVRDAEYFVNGLKGETRRTLEIIYTLKKVSYVDINIKLKET